MLSTFIISLREFLEAFLIVGVFLGISRKLELKREKEILLAAVCGIVISLILPVIVFSIGERAHELLSEKNSDLLAGYLMVFSGCFIAYVVFSLHHFFAIKRSRHIITAHEKFKKNIFDLSLFLTIVFFIIREGFEIALFTATTALFSTFMENLAGLAAGFVVSAGLGALTCMAYLKFTIGKIFKLTEYMIVLLGAALVTNGMGELLEIYFDLHLSTVGPLPISFLPSKETIFGGFLNTMFGIQHDFSLGRLAIMAVYITTVYLLFLRDKAKRAV